MAIRKDQILVSGQFSPNKNVIYMCQVNDSNGLIKDILITTVILGFFSFLLVQWFAIIIIPISWITMIGFFLPKHYRFIQFSKHTLVLGVGSIPSLIKRGSIYNLIKFRYDEIKSVRFDKWERKRKLDKKDSFGRIEINYFEEKKKPFEFLIKTEDLIRLMKIFESYKFQVKVDKSRTRRELLLRFSPSKI